MLYSCLFLSRRWCQCLEYTCACQCFLYVSMCRAYVCPCETSGGGCSVCRGRGGGLYGAVRGPAEVRSPHPLGSEEPSPASEDLLLLVPCCLCCIPARELCRNDWIKFNYPKLQLNVKIRQETRTFDLLIKTQIFKDLMNKLNGASFFFASIDFYRNIKAKIKKVLQKKDTWIVLQN